MGHGEKVQYFKLNIKNFVLLKRSMKLIFIIAKAVYKGYVSTSISKLIAKFSNAQNLNLLKLSLISPYPIPIHRG